MLPFKQNCWHHTTVYKNNTLRVSETNWPLVYDYLATNWAVKTSSSSTECTNNASGGHAHTTPLSVCFNSDIYSSSTTTMWLFYWIMLLYFTFFTLMFIFMFLSKRLVCVWLQRVLPSSDQMRTWGWRAWLKHHRKMFYVVNQNAVKWLLNHKLPPCYI